jgi:hypothetical protein
MTAHQEKQQSRIITITECPTEPCAVYYTDSLSQSVLVICRNPKHGDRLDIGIEIEKRNAGVTTASSFSIDGQNTDTATSPLAHKKKQVTVHEDQERT